MQRLERVCTQLLRAAHAPVAAASMRAVLTSDEYANYTSQLTAPQTHYDVLREQGRPDALSGYIELLRRADFTNARANAAANRVNNYRNALKLREQSDHEYELACEYMEEQFSVCDAGERARLEAWLDRPFDYGIGGLISIDCVGVARVIGSTSQYCRHKQQRTQQKLSWRRQCQLDALGSAANDMLYEPDVTANSNMSLKLLHYWRTCAIQTAFSVQQRIN